MKLLKRMDDDKKCSNFYGRKTSMVLRNKENELCISLTHHCQTFLYLASQERLRFTELISS